MANTLATAPAATQFQYHFDGYLDGAACGWILYRAQPTQPVALGVYSDGELLASGNANIFREDLAAHKIGNGACAFRIPLSPDAEQAQLEVRVLHTDYVLEGSQHRPQEWDACVSQLIKAFRFEKYRQFNELSLSTMPKNPLRFERSQRLADAFGHPGSSLSMIPSILEWAIGTERQGGAGFFESQSHHILDDIAWYLFDYRSSVKKHLPMTALGSLFSPAFPSVPGMTHYSMAYSLWLHKNGVRLNTIEADSKEHFFGFVSSLLHSNTPIDKSLLPAWLTANVNKLAILKGTRLPRMSKYAELKYERSYLKHYDIAKPVHYLAYLFDIALHSEANEARLMGDDVIAFFKQPVSVHNGSVSRFALAIWSYYAKAQTKQGDSKPIDDANIINTWFKSTWLRKFPAHYLYLQTDLSVGTEKEASPKGVCYVVSHWENESGLTKNAHMSIKALRMAGIPAKKVMLDGTILDEDETLPNVNASSLARDIVLLHVNADKAPEGLAALAEKVDLDSAHLIGFYLWELETVPDCHLLGLELVDEIWAPTSFVKDLYAPYCAEKIRYVGKAISVPVLPEICPEKFGISAEATSFLITYDINSGVERKNPLAAVRAFQAAFQGTTDVQLIIKTTPYKPGHWGDPFNQWAQILKSISSDERIVVIDTYISDDEMFELVAAVDVVVSTHRAEGFGYLPAYGLIYDRQVIATGYSGVTDFAPLSNMMMADFALIDVPCGKFVYPVPGAQWADVNIKHLGRLMAECHQRKSGNIRLDMNNDAFREFFSYEQLSQRYLAALEKTSVL